MSQKRPWNKIQVSAFDKILPANQQRDACGRGTTNPGDKPGAKRFEQNKGKINSDCYIANTLKVFHCERL